VWQRAKGSDPVKKYMQQLLEVDPSLSVPVLQQFSTWARMGGAGVGQPEYEALTKLVEGDVLLKAIQSAGLLKEGTTSDAATEARDFAHIHAETSRAK